MPTNPSGSALTRIATALEQQVRDETRIAESAKYPNPPSDTIQPVPQPVDPEQRRARDLSQQIYYSMRIPAIAPETLLDMEARLPGVVEFLASLNGRPAARADFLAAVAATKQQGLTSQRSGEGQQRLLAITQSLSEASFGEGMARNPALGLAAVGVGMTALTVAGCMLGYTIAHNWPK